MNKNKKWLFRLLSLVITAVFTISNTKIVVSRGLDNLKLINNPYQELIAKNIEYENGQIISPVCPYEDFYSLFTKLPLGHTVATGKGINIGVYGGEDSSFIYFVARNSKVYKLESLNSELLRENNIRIAVIEDINNCKADELEAFVTDCRKSGISVVIEGDLARTDDSIKLVNHLWKLGAISVGQIQRQGVTYAYEGSGTRAYNNRLKEINIDLFAPNIYKSFVESYKYSLYGTAGALALIMENKNLSGEELKKYIINHSRKVWQINSIDGTNVNFGDVQTNNITSQEVPREGSQLYFFNQLDFQNLLDVRLASSWNSNIYNLDKAWKISKGNIDVAIIDQGFHPENPFIKNNIVEAKQFGNTQFNDNFHGTSMAHALLEIAPEAKLHLLLADVFSPDVKFKPDYIIKAIDYCIEKKIPVISMSWVGWFGNEKTLIDKINEARDKGIIISWFWYPSPEKQEGIIGTGFTYSNMGDNIAAIDRFVEANMYYPQEIQAGLSYTAPQAAGLCAVIKAKYPGMSPAEVENCLKENSVVLNNGALVPNMFRALNSLSDKDYYYILYNKNKVSSNDLIALGDYVDRLSDGNRYTAILKDVSSLKDAAEIYSRLKEEAGRRKGKLLGIQIFGASSDVPAFAIRFKVKMQNGIDDSGNFKSDFFYSNFDNDAAVLRDDFSIYKAFEEKLKVSFLPSWRVARLPLSAGEIALYINKYYDYRAETKGNNRAPYISFSNPIFPTPVHSDDMGYFIKERLDKEFGFLGSGDYRLYGNKEGLYPVTTQVSGEFDNTNLENENEKGIANFIINTHGQEDNLDKCIFIAPKDLDRFKDRVRLSSPYNGNNDLLEVRMSFLNKNNINTVLAKNYYTLTLWTCLNSFDLRNDTIVHEALASGKAIDAMAASSIISNNGVNNSASLEDMKKNNFYYFMYSFFKYLSKGFSRSESFLNAQRDYSSEILKHTDLLGEGNYGFNMHNVLSYHYLGVLDIPEAQNKGKIVLPEKDIKNVDNSSSDNSNKNEVSSSGHITFGDDNLEYKTLDFRTDNPDKNYRVDFVGYNLRDNNFNIKVKYFAPKNGYFTLFLQGDTPGLKEFINNGTKQGDNTVILKFSVNEAKAYKAGLALNMGDMNFIFIDRDLVRQIIALETSQNSQTEPASDKSIAENQNTVTGSQVSSVRDNDTKSKKTTVAEVKKDNAVSCSVPIYHMTFNQEPKVKLHTVGWSFSNYKNYYSIKSIGVISDKNSCSIYISYSAVGAGDLKLSFTINNTANTEYYKKSIKKGKNIAKISFSREELKAIKGNISINLGGKSSININSKEILQ